MRKIVKLAVAAAVLVGAGCATLGRQAFREPEVTFKNVKVNGLGLTGGSLDIILNVHNPNNFRLDATKLRYRLLVDTVNFATGEMDQRFTVQEKDSTSVRIPVNFTYAGIGEAGRQLLGTGTVNYRVAGDVEVATPVGRFTVPYDKTGRFAVLSGPTR